MRQRGGREGRDSVPTVSHGRVGASPQGDERGASASRQRRAERSGCGVLAMVGNRAVVGVLPLAPPVSAGHRRFQQTQAEVPDSVLDYIGIIRVPGILRL